LHPSKGIHLITLVTGATGLLGNNVVRLLLDRDQAVRVMVRKNSDPRPLEELNVEVVYGDVREPLEVENAMRDIDVVIHCAAFIHFGWTKFDVSRAVNVEGTRHVAAAARAVGAKMIHVSTCDTLASGKKNVPADEETPGEKVPCAYVVSKREAEEVVQQEIAIGLHAVITNPTFMMGPWDWKPSSGRMILETVRRFTPIAPRGGLSICDVRDVAAGILAAVEKGQVGQRYILSGENISYLDLWRLFARVASGKGPLATLGPLLRFIVGRIGDLRGKLSRHEPEVNSASLRLASDYHYYTCERAKQELGYASRPKEESIEAEWKWLVDYGYAGP